MELVYKLLQEVKKTGNVKIAPIYPRNDRLPGVVGLVVVTPDWAGLAEAVAGLVHAKGHNLLYENAFVVEREYVGGEGQYGVVVVRLLAQSPEHLEVIKKDIEEVILALEEIAPGSDSVRNVLQIGFIRIINMVKISEELRKIVNSEEEYREITKPQGELEKFMLSRTVAYISDRSPELLARQVYQNFKFIRTLREKGRGLFVDIHNEPTRNGVQTCITVAGFERHISMDDVLDEIREYFPKFKIKYDKQFVTADGIIVIRVEITDEHDRPLSEQEIELLKNRLTDWLSKRKRQRFMITNLIELIGRILVPTLISEAKNSGIAQFYMIPEDVTKDYADFVVVLVVPLTDRGQEISRKVIEKLSVTPGISVKSYRPPKISKGCEILIVNIRALAGEFKSEEEIYDRVKDAVKSVVPNLRDFDEGMRKMERERLDEVMKILEDHRVDQAFVREFFYSMNGFERVSTPPQHLANKILFAYRLLREFFRDGKAFDVIREKHSVIMGFAVPVGNGRTEKIMNMLTDFSPSFVRIDDFGTSLVVVEIKNMKNHKIDPQKLDAVIEEVENLVHS